MSASSRHCFILSRWLASGSGWPRTQYVQITLLSCNGPFQFSVLLLQKSNLLLKYPLEAMRKAMGHKLRAIQPEDCDVEVSCWRQSVKTTSDLILNQMRRHVVEARMKQSTALSKIDVIGPIVAFVLVALDAGIDQIVEFVTSSCRARAIVVESELAPCSCLGHTAIAARSAIALPDSLKEGMRHGSGYSTQDR